MSKLIIMNLIVYYSQMYNFDPNIALAVAKVESNYNQNAIGSHGEVGVFQILSNEPEKYINLQNNIKGGILRLKKAKSSCKHRGDIDYLVCYNAGLTGGSKIKNPKKFPYVIKVNSELKLDRSRGLSSQLKVDL